MTQGSRFGPSVAACELTSEAERFKEEKGRSSAAGGGLDPEWTGVTGFSLSVME